MKKLSKVISVLSASAMVMSMLAGCSDASGDVTSTESGDATVTESGASTFKIGGIGPTTGAAAIYGSDVRDAIQIAVDEINEAGGINGYQIEYKFEDDEHNA